MLFGASLYFAASGLVKIVLEHDREVSLPNYSIVLVEMGSKVSDRKSYYYLLYLLNSLMAGVSNNFPITNPHLSQVPYNAVNPPFSLSLSESFMRIT